MLRPGSSLGIPLSSTSKTAILFSELPSRGKALGKGTSEALSNSKSQRRLPLLLPVALSIQEELKRVSERIEQLSHFQEEEVRGIGKDCLFTNGKKIRAALVLLSAKMFGEISSSIINLAAVAELIHSATLIHDDVFDGASYRRGKPTLHSLWGSDLALLFGDYLLCQGFVLSYDISQQYGKLLAETLREMCIGEIMENMNRCNPFISPETYLGIIERKTASLFETCCKMGALAVNAQDSLVSKIGKFGRAAGMAFQVVDDLLDVTASPEDMGKPVANDLSLGTVTLPIIYALQEISDEERKRIASRITGNSQKGHATPDLVTEILALVRATGGITRAREVALGYADQARAILAELPPSLTKERLMDLTGFLISRDR